MKSIKRNIVYSIYAISLTFLTLLSTSAFAQVSVNVNGTQYQCSTGGNSGGGTTGMNYCRCRLRQYSSNDEDYFLEKYNPTTQEYTVLQSFTSTGNSEGDKQACLEAKQDPACLFAASASRFDLMPIQ